MDNKNLSIVGRLLELAKNPLEYTVYPKECRQEYIFLSNTLQYAKVNIEREFNEAFKMSVGRYKQSLEKDKGYGWFHAPEKLVWLQMQINQLDYAIYGERFIREIRFNESLGKDAYRDLICQIDRTALMNEQELKEHQKQIEKITTDLAARIVAQNKG